MRKWIARQLRRMADWLDPLPSVVDPALINAARGLVVDIAGTPHSTPYKRSQAMKAMRRLFPDARSRDHALAIELAVREVIP